MISKRRIEESQDTLTVRSWVEFIQIHMFGPLDDPKLLGACGGGEEGFGFGAWRMRVEASGNQQFRAANSGDVVNGAQRVRAHAKTKSALAGE